MKFIPVTTYGRWFPIDSQIQPHLPKFVDDVMVSYQFAQHMKKRPPLTLWIDSGGYATHRPIARVLPMKDRAGFTVAGEVLTPEKVLAFQERHADVGFTLDFILVPDLGTAECTRRYDWTIQNALWAQQHRTNMRMQLYASVQALCPTTAREAARIYRQQGMDGIGVGGLVPRIRDWKALTRILEAVLEEAGNTPVHAFGLGTPALLKLLQKMGVSSSDSSSYVQWAGFQKNWKGRVATAPLSEAATVRLALSNLSELLQTVGLQRMEPFQQAG
ncbi:hypothetical protein [Deinococcus cellulosilyticus]|uniref:tRNA-guanine(15) transglycosylase-like domain-containing protein n=1 Tax=Deinococcus cellulosilyticus (strain DSM 18568 / NBRC 106333 / KACC 11606 / 5516J-15) TaxID=1223518 RepID=A0A511NBC7_DEIC1|nr:hypothetical protein [Deinococcus cellulosilyticus]GEM50129.1 hypothetical protein DC3_57640 [Deinococcus cellulosilyticus NBRC 106333 = KACC 11606]